MKKVVSFFIIFCMLFSLNVYGFTITYENSNGEIVILNDFLDTQGHWAHDTILKVADYGLINGYQGNFMPNQPIKRGDLAIILDRMLGLKTISYNYFNDLNNSDYYASSLLKCVAYGYITGIGPNAIDPNGYATREQVAVILSRMFDFVGEYSGNTNFKDDNKISSWARNSVSAMSKLGYINGDNNGYMNPQSYITRAELVTLLNNIANVYIPNRDTTQFGTSEYKNDFPTNVVTSRNIILTQSKINRDLILTPDSTTLTLNNSRVQGRILSMARQNIILNNTSVAEIVLLDGKSTISGIDENVDSVRISANASESSLDAIPNKVILDSGARVRIAEVMYENESTKTKTYYAKDLQANISDEQGYIIGGPKISGVVFTQDMDNTITVSNIRVIEGDSEIKEIGVIWLEQDDNENAVNPTYKKNDGRKIYRSNKIDELIEFEVGEVEGTSAYRVYVKDKDGLYAYSNSTIFSEYEFTTKLNIYDNNYPERLDVEIIFRGESIPEINGVRVVYDVDELYNETHNEISLRLYYDPDAEYQPDPTEYKRYIGTITSPIEIIDGEVVYTPPTAFGYIITFRNGTLINRFPILTNAVPEGVSPMSDLETGVATYNGSNNLTIKNNKVTTRYIVPQEVGIVYKISTNDIVSRPTADASGWIRKSSYVDLDVNESEIFNTSIPLTSTEGYTHYAVYVKTSNGYWYGDVKKFNNSVQGEEGGYRILDIETQCLGDNSVLFKLEMDNSKGMPTLLDTIEISGIGKFTFSELEMKALGNKVYFLVSNLSSSKTYDISLYIKNTSEKKSNSVFTEFNISQANILTLIDKHVVGGNILYTINSPNIPKYNFEYSNVFTQYDDVHPSLYDSIISVQKIENISNRTVIIEFLYYAEGVFERNLYWKFRKTLALY